ncbi:uncharacterized protein BXZ73DRAFT_6505, partial [Epithele typhae]|uniref:uncharacterized protein n=1 Tax=Epithele typhae TaxID=378194 RepID=UPI002008CB22
MPVTRNAEGRAWRRCYTDASVILAYADVLDCSSGGDTKFALSAISYLDHAIVIAGAPGDGRMDCIQTLIKRIQSDCLRYTAPPSSSWSSDAPRAAPPPVPPLSSAAQAVLRLPKPPSLATFGSRFSQRPFVLPGFLRDTGWPALDSRPWRSRAYLGAVAGPGRVVPIEVGNDYRADEWTQKMMPWDAFLGALQLDGDREGTDMDANVGTGAEVLYLAQHNLFAQFPALLDDVVVPDYVYADMEPPKDCPQYMPPANDEQLILNAWLGPKGAVSPAHTDPFFNFFAQVVGRKTVWLAPPSATSGMYPYAPGGVVA